MNEIKKPAKRVPRGTNKVMESASSLSDGGISDKENNDKGKQEREKKRKVQAQRHFRL